MLAREKDDVVRDFHTAYYNEAWDRGGNVAVGKATWAATRWFNVALFKCPFDVLTQQEILVETKPEIVVETGTSRGGSALFYASLCQLLGRGEVVTVDIRDEAELGVPRPVHPLITYVTGSSIDPEIVARVHALAKGKRALVVLDSNHEKTHVLAEIIAYAPLVPMGGYLIVEDTNVNGHPVFPEHGPGPWEAVEDFLAATDEFEVDESRCGKHLFSHNPRGYLKRVRSAS